ncbi:unnamed protein product [Psylliodes chrysocephalus]|uniref:Nucleic-acid-binding protein from transposon X-element n=1 Tax=Psylliodes chrysocephalus TaxID=3402493 RepID=A0A9P0GBS6_9CUCU|nr:unnamed protein product [Psylliodes chrysocephala]
MLKKSIDENKDIESSLLQYRNTPLKNLNYSPSQLLNSRCCKTKLPIPTSSLVPAVCTNVSEKIEHKLNTYTKYYNKQAKDLKPLEPGQNVIIHNDSKKTWDQGQIIDHHVYPRSYLVRDGCGNTLRRNRVDLKPSVNTFQESANLEEHISPISDKGTDQENYPQNIVNLTSSPEPCTPSQQLIVTTRTGRIIKRPDKLNLRARQKLEKEHRELSINTSRRSSASSTSPRSPITLQLKRSIHHPYRHVSTPKPKESHRSSNSERRDSRERSHKTDEKTRKRSKNHSSNRDRGEMEVNEADLYPPPSSEHKKSSRNITEKFAEKNDENAAFYTPPQEITSNSSTMTDYSPDSDPMSRYGMASATKDATTDPTLISAELVLQNLDSAINNINNENSGPINNSVHTINQNSAPPNNVSVVTEPKFESAYNTLALPNTVTARVLNFGIDPPTSSEDERGKQFNFKHKTLLTKRKNMSPVGQEAQDNPRNMPPENPNKIDEFQIPKKTKKFRTNFIKMLEQKAAATISTTNRFEAIGESESDSESETEPTTSTENKIKGKATPNIRIKGQSTRQKSSVKNTIGEKTKPKSRDTIPPIVIDGNTDNHVNLAKDLKEIVKGKYSIKYTNATTVIYTENDGDYKKLLSSIKEAEIPHHTYTSKADKTHAFVLRGMGKGVEKNAIIEDMQETYEIAVKEIYLMSTKFRPLYLVVTDPAITLECQAWGHATANCGRPPRCLKCAGDHLTNVCTKTRETPATCANCHGSHPANYTKCEAYLERASRLEERRATQKPPLKKYVPAPPPTQSAWDKNRNPTAQELRDFPPLPTSSNSQSKFQPQPPRRNSNVKNVNEKPPQTGGMDDLFALNKEFEELNSMGDFSVKHTNASTIIFVEDREDHSRVLSNIKAEKLSYHTYTSYDDKSHAFVLRGLAEGTKVTDIIEDLEEEHEIKARNVFQMNTKERPLFLVVTDPAITLDYLNKNTRRILYTRVVWEMRKSTKAIIQCHNCQQWGHATSNCGRPSKCVKCAGDHHTRTCTKTRETPATCVNCGGDHPANYSKCQAYTSKLERLEERRPRPQQKFVPAPAPRTNQWEARKQARSANIEYPALPTRKHEANENKKTNSERAVPSNIHMDNVTTLNKELAELNKLINIGELTRAIRALNAALKQCITGQQIIETYNAFMSDVDNQYKLRN